MFTGLSAFPLTPLCNDTLDVRCFIGLIERLAATSVDSITALGSTGSYAYLSPQERARVAHLTVQHAGSVPVFVGVGSLRTSDVLTNVRAAEDAGAAAVLLAPMTYQPLTADEVYELFGTVATHTALPIIVYDNPGTTHFNFSTELYARIAQLDGIASIKIPPVPSDAEAASARIREIRAVVPDHVTIGISGDPHAAAGLAAGCDAWYSVLAGVLPATAIQLMAAVKEGRHADLKTQHAQLQPLWALFMELGGSIRVAAAIAEILGLVQSDCLPRPLLGLTDEQRRRVGSVIDLLGFTG